MTLKEWLNSERRGPRGKVRPARGTQEWLALRLDCQQALVSKWVRRITTPERYGTKIVRLSKGKVTLPELMRIPPPSSAVLVGGVWRKP